MHYVLKHRIAEALLADANGLTGEFYRAQDVCSTLDQNNFGEWPKTPVYDEPTGQYVLRPCGVSHDTVPVPTSEDEDGCRESVTRWHYKDATSGVEASSQPSVWIDQTSCALEFSVFETAPYLILAFAQVHESSGNANPFWMEMRVLLDGETQEPHSSNSVAKSTGIANLDLHMPLFWSGSVILPPGEHRVMMSLRVKEHDQFDIEELKRAAIGLVR